MKRILPIILLIVLGLFGLLYLRNWQIQSAQAATANYIVISEIQIEGEITADEFVELYNPTDTPQDLTGWTLYRKTASGTTEIPVATASGNIPSRGYYLFANTDFDGGILADTSYTENVSDNNSVILRDNNGSLVDLVGMGTANSNETAPVLNPIDNRSVERKANSTSTEADMASGGIDETNGNGEDTDNNLSDFIRRVSPHVSDPQNSQSSSEPTPTPSPTDEPSPTNEPSPTPTEEPSPTPTVEPTETPIPTEVPSVTPTAEPSPTDEPSPTPTVELSPTPTIEPSPTVEPSPTLEPTPTPSGDKIIHQNFIITCTLNFKPMRIFNKAYFFPLISCHKTAFN